jgi:hypothetical protein
MSNRILLALIFLAFGNCYAQGKKITVHYFPSTLLCFVRLFFSTECMTACEAGLSTCSILNYNIYVTNNATVQEQEAVATGITFFQSFHISSYSSISVHISQHSIIPPVNSYPSKPHPPHTRTLLMEVD